MQRGGERDNSFRLVSFFFLFFFFFFSLSLPLSLSLSLSLSPPVSFCVSVSPSLSLPLSLSLPPSLTLSPHSLSPPSLSLSLSPLSPPLSLPPPVSPPSLSLSVCLSVCLSHRPDTNVPVDLLTLSILPKRYFCTCKNLFRLLVVASGIPVFPRAYVFIFCFICWRYCHISLFVTSALGLSRFNLT